MAAATDLEQHPASCLAILKCCFGRGKDKTLPAASPQNPVSSGSPRPQLATSFGPNHLWREAYERLDEKTQKCIGEIPANPEIENSGWVNNLVGIVRKKEKECESATQKLKVAGREIIWRDYAKRVVAIVTTIGDISISFAPAPSSVVWSAVKTLMQTHVKQCEDLAAIFGCADRALNLVRRGQVYEVVYLSNTPRGQATEGFEDLKAALVDCYKNVLELLAHAITRLKEKQAMQFLHALIQPGQGDSMVSGLSECEDRLAKAAQACGSIMLGEHVRLLQSLDEPIRLVQDDVANLLKHVEEDRMREILKDISSVPFGDHHEGKREVRTPGTCEWLLKRPKFIEWEASSCSSILWLQGSVGVGKSFLSSKVIDRYRHDNGTNDQQKSQNDEGFAYFYCDRSDEARRKPKTILASYVRQLAQLPDRSSKIHEDILEFYTNAKKEERHFSTTECKMLLSKLVNSYPRTVLIIDGLDECDREDRHDLLDTFSSLTGDSVYPVKIFITSRPETDIRNRPSVEDLVVVDTTDNQSDIEKYIEHRFRRPGLEMSDGVKEQVKLTITSQSNGMFKWAALQWEQLKGLRTDESVKERLGRLPQDLEAAYHEIYAEAQHADQLILQRTVKWVLCAKTPLSSDILLPAIWLHGVRDTNDKDILPVRESTVESICRHLVVKDSILGTWRFSHASVAEYFEEKHKDWIGRAHEDVAKELLLNVQRCWPAHAALNRNSFETDHDSHHSESDPVKYLEPRHPLQLYTSEYWGLHVHSISLPSEGQSEVQRLLKRLLGGPEDGPPGPTSAAYQEWSKSWKRSYASDLQPADKPIFGICVLGLHDLLPGWWDKSLDILQVNEDGLDLLALAAKHGHKELCSDLIHRGIGPDRILNNSWAETALIAAIKSGHAEIGRLLLTEGWDPNFVGRGSSPICEAARTDSSSDMVKILLEKQADPNIECSNCFFGCALEAAILSYNRMELLRLLLESGATANVVSKSGEIGSPLEAATALSWIDCMLLLIEKGAEVNSGLERGPFGSALAVAASMGHLDCVQVLIERGAEVNARLEHGEFGSALAAAACGRRGGRRGLDCVQFLTERGAEVNARLEHGAFGSALAAAACGGDLRCVQFLTERGAEVNARLEHGEFGSALIAAVYCNKLDCVEFLVEHGAKLNAHVQYGSFGSALAAALLGDCAGLEMIKYLIEEKTADTSVLSLSSPSREYLDDSGGWEPLVGRYRQRANYLMEEASVEKETLRKIGCPV